MRKFLLFVFIVVGTNGFAQQMWRPMGPDDANQPVLQFTNKTDAAIDHNGVIYVAYNGEEDDASNPDGTSRISVRRFINNHWEQVGSPEFSNGAASQYEIAIDGNNIPYVIYLDGSNSNKATVQKFTNGAWQVVGTAGFTNTAEDPDIAIDYNNVPHIVSRETGSGATVRKFNGTTWEVLGTTPISTNNLVRYTRIAVSSNNTVYVAYGGDQNISDRAYVKFFDGASWQSVGGGAASTTGARDIELALDSNNIPYFIYTSIEPTQKSIVKKFSGTTWDILASIVTDPTWSNNHIAINDSNVPYIAYFSGNSWREIVEKLTGTTWEEVGNTIQFNNIQNIVFDDNNNLFVGEDPANNLKIRKFNTTAWEIVGDEGGISVPDTAGHQFGTAMAVDSQGIPHIVYTIRNDSGSYDLLMKKYVNSEWVSAPPPGVSGGLAPQLFLAPNNKLFLLTQTSTGGYAFRRYDGSWTGGMLGFGPSYCRLTADNAGTPYVIYPSNGGVCVRKNLSMAQVGGVPITPGAVGGIAVSPDNTVYIAYTEPSGQASVRKMLTNDPYAWPLVGSGGFSAGTATNLNIAIDQNSILYVSYVTNGDLLVQKFNGSGWEYVGTPIIDVHTMHTFKFDKLNVPHLLYNKWIDNEGSWPLSLRKFNGTDWELVGSAEFFNANLTEGNPALAFTNDNIPLVANDDSSVFAKYFGDANALHAPEYSVQDHNISIYPNPVSGMFSLRADSAISKVTVYDITGKIILEKHGVFENIDASGLGSGIYILKATVGNKVFSARLIKH
jgi:hypothetical protein